MRELDTIRKDHEDSSNVLSLDSLKLDMKANDVTVNGEMERLIRDKKITAVMATSMMNDANYAYDVAKNLIQMGESLFAGGNLDMNEAVRSVALTEDEVAEILDDNK